MADKKHWRIKPIKQTGATYRVVYGQRGPGKTFGVLYDALERYLQDGTKLGIIRRMDEDYTGANSAKAYYDMLMHDANNDNNIELLTKGQYTGVEYFNDQPIYTDIVEMGTHVPVVEQSDYHYSCRSLIAAAIINIAQNGYTTEDALKEAEDQLKFEMGL